MDEGFVRLTGRGIKNASVIQPSPISINPYHLGLKIFEDIERRYDNPTKEERAVLFSYDGKEANRRFL